MKKIEKLEIEPGRMLKSNELLTLKGGNAWLGYCAFLCDNQEWVCGPASGTTRDSAAQTLADYWSPNCQGSSLVICADNSFCQL